MKSIFLYRPQILIYTIKNNKKVLIYNINIIKLRHWNLYDHFFVILQKFGLPIRSFTGYAGVGGQIMITKIRFEHQNSQIGGLNWSSARGAPWVI